MNTKNTTSLTQQQMVTAPQAHDDTHGTVLVVAAGLILGTMGIFVIESGQNPMTTVAFRCVFGCLALLCWAVMTRRLAELKISGKALWGVVGAGLLMASSWGLYFAAIARTSIGMSTVVFHIQPFLTMALGAWLLKEQITRRQVGLTILACIGLALSTGLLDASVLKQNMNHDYLVGILLSFIGAMVYAFMPLVAKKLTSVSALALTWWQCLVGMLLTFWWPLLYGMPPLSSLAWLFGLGAIHSGLAYVLMFAGFARLSTGRMAVLQFIYPMTAFVVDWVIYNHSLSLWQWLGLVVMGVAIWSVKRGG